MLKQQAQVGQIWENDITGQQEKITEIKDRTCSSVMVKVGSQPYHKLDGKITTFGSVDRDGYPQGWGGWHLLKEAPVQTPLAVGQIWDRDGWKLRVVEITGNETEAVQIGDFGFYKDGHVYPGFGAVFAPNRKHLSDDWKLLGDPGSNSKIRIGQVWESADGCVVKITAIKPGMASGDVSKGSICILRGSHSNFTPLDKDGKAPHFISMKWKLIQDVHAPDNASEDTNQAKPQIKEEPKQETTMSETKVGQIWYHARRNFKVKITAVRPGNAISALQIGDCEGWKDGYLHELFTYLPWGNGWDMIQEAPEIKIGSRVQHKTWNDNRGKWVGVVNGINSNGDLEVRFEDHHKYMGKYPNDYHTIFLKDVLLLEDPKEEAKEERQLFGQMVKADFKDALWRSGTTQLTNAAQSTILAMMKDRGADDQKLAVVKEILASEMGSILIRCALGYGITYMPKIGEDPRAQRLAKEFRVSAMSSGMNEVAGLASQYLLPAISSAITSLPQERKRVSQTEESIKQEDITDSTQSEIKKELMNNELS